MRAGRLVRVGAVGAVAGALLVTQALPAQARHSYDDREVIELTKPGAVRGAGGLALHLTAKDAVIASNVAWATTSCDDCHATAIAFQVVVVDKAPSTINVGNLAYASNEGCARCRAEAYAYQFVLVFQGNATLSGEGYRRLRAIDNQLQALARSGASPEQLSDGADECASEVSDILGSELRVRPQLKKKVVQRQPGTA